MAFALVSVAMAGASTLVLRATRARMPGGWTRLFMAYWVQNAVMISGLLAAGLAWSWIFGAPEHRTLVEAFVLLSIVLGTPFGLDWLLRRLPWTAKLIQDLAAARRPLSSALPHPIVFRG
jgi:hypothetical protein